jgi:hypothetical protein
VTQNHYSNESARTIKVRARGNGWHEADVVASAHGWYDVRLVGVSRAPTSRHPGDLVNIHNAQ